VTAENLKPRGAKAPLHLLPWRTLLAVAPEHVPPDIAAAIRATGTEHGRAFMADVAKRLLARAGADVVAHVFAFGASRYRPWNWADDPTRIDDYAGATFRHLCAEHGSFGATPQSVDPDSGLLHVGHGAASAWIWLEHDGATAGEAGGNVERLTISMVNGDAVWRSADGGSWSRVAVIDGVACHAGNAACATAYGSLV
jgi:hypothetical protein